MLSHRNPASSHVREERPRSGDLGVVRAGKLPCLEREAGREANRRNHHLRVHACMVAAAGNADKNEHEVGRLQKLNRVLVASQSTSGLLVGRFEEKKSSPRYP